MPCRPRLLLSLCVTTAALVACSAASRDSTEEAPAPTPASPVAPDASGGPSELDRDATAPEAAKDGDAATDAGPSWVVGEPFPIEGYGAATRGGFQPGHDVYHVTTLADDGPGSLRAGLATSNAPRVIVFDLDGTIAAASAFVLPSNLTIDGRGHDISIRGKGFVIPGSDDVILVNLAIADVGPSSEDGVQIGSATAGPSEHIALDHVSFVQTGSGGDSKNVDEAISVVFGSRFITIAWCRFERWEKVMLFGNGDAPAAVDSQMRVTVHHTYGHATGRRHPQARFGVFDFYDDEWDDWHMYGWAFESPYRESFGAQAQDGAQLIVENVIARRTVQAFDAFSQANDLTRCESGGVVDERGTWIVPDSTAPLAHRVGCPAVATPLARPYAATIEPADAKLRVRLEKDTGNVLR